MAWTKVYHDTSKQDQSSTKLNDDGSVRQQCIETWIAVNNGMAATPVEAETATDGTKTVPTVGASYTIGGQAGWQCTERIPKRETASPYTFTIQVTYVRKTYTPPSDGGTRWNADINISGEKFTQTAYQSKGDDPPKDITNTAGDYFDPTVSDTFSDERIEISYQTTEADSAAFVGVRNKVNSDTVSFTIKGMTRDFDARHLYLDEATMSASLPLDDVDATPTWTVRLVLLSREDGYTTSIANKGFMQINGDGDRVHCTGDDGKDSTESCWLDDDGAQTTDANYQDFKIEGEASFAGLFGGLA